MKKLLFEIIDLYLNAPGSPESELDRRARMQSAHDSKFQEILNKCKCVHCQKRWTEQEFDRDMHWCEYS